MDQIFRPNLTRVVLTGSESVGKSTMAERLASHFGVEHVPEFVREYVQQKGSTLDFRDHGPIAHGQMSLENDYASRAADLLIQDTDLFSTVVYCEHYFGRCPAFIVDAAVERMAHLYLLLDIDLPWVADGVRDRPDRRAEMHELFMQKLSAYGANMVLVRGNGEERFAAGVNAIGMLLEQRTPNADS